MGYRKLGRDSSARKALFRSILTSFFKYERGDLHARRQVLARLMDEEVVKKLFDEIAPKYNERQGGYTRVLKLGPRRGDAAPMAILELV